MTAGLEVFDASGISITNVTTSLAKVLGMATTVANQAGSVTLPSTANGFRVFAVKTYGADEDYKGTAGTVVTVSGLTISWTAATLATRIIYGVF